MAETGLPLGAVYSGATAELLSEARKKAEASADGYIPSAFNPSTCSQKGYCTVARDRVPLGKNKEPTPDAREKGARMPDPSKPGFELYYEVHGTGPRKVVFVMGLNNSCFGWLNQVEHLAKDPQYSVVVLDNRGYGNTETPSGAYKTSEMALDVFELVDFLGWKEARQLNVVGISMGGMISLEMAKRSPQRIASLTLISTTSGRGHGEKKLSASLPPWTGVSTITRMIAGRTLGFDSDEYRVNAVSELLFPPKWLDETSKQNGKKNRENMQATFAFRFGFTRRQTLYGAMNQVRAALTHRVTPAELRKIDSEIPQITIATGDNDNLVNPANSVHLAKHLKRAKLHQVPDAGHAMTLQLPEVINGFLDETFSAAQEKLEQGFDRGRDST